jgi:transcriptional regulator with XRE-family HTH domain
VEAENNDRGVDRDSEGAIGERVKRVRTEAGMTAKDLAGRTGIHESGISRIEHGKAGRPCGRTLDKIGAALGCSPSYLATGLGPVYLDTGLCLVPHDSGQYPAIGLKALIRVMIEEHLGELLDGLVERGYDVTITKKRG